ncbi:MAG TPA: DUF1553 domain-containing protein, partial [Planctomycetota bacterium]|nr:DUF1553 domain-containing protein [Planctomycetota bacterium]
AVFDELDDSLRTISEGFLGVTIGCARCHDHEFDPFPQEDYYRMLAFLRGIRPYTIPRYDPNARSPRLLDDSPEGRARLEVERARYVADLMEQKDALVERARALALQEPAPEHVPQIEGALADFLPDPDRRAWYILGLKIEAADGSFSGDLPWALCVDEVPPAEMPATHLLIRGEATNPGPEVEPRFPAALCADDASARPSLAEPAPGAESSGRRLALARWIASSDNPLTARVIVNRVWQAHFGRGLTGTPNDFGAQGEFPSHPELLDWLAAEFVADGWSLKRLHRRILLSETYRRSSRADAARDERALEVDREGLLLWRQRSRRLEGEVIRDSILAVSGLLVSGSGGRGFFPVLQRGALAGGSRPGEGWEPVEEGACDRRSLYAYAKRTLPIPFLQAFDGPGSASLPVGRRTTTFVSNQALMLLNGELTGRASAALAERIVEQGGDGLEAWIPRAFRQVLARDPNALEVRLLLDYARAQSAAFAELPRDRLEFRPLLPERVGIGFLQQIDPESMLSGPRSEWTRLHGRWGNAYNATLERDADRGPAALFEAGLDDGRLSARVLLANGTRTGSLYLRAHADGDVLGGLELRLDASNGTLDVRHHDPEHIETLGCAQVGVAVETWYTLEAELVGSRLRVWFDCEQGSRIDVEVPPSDGHAGLGVRVTGEALRLESVTLHCGDAVRVLTED